MMKPILSATVIAPFGVVGIRALNNSVQDIKYVSDINLYEVQQDVFAKKIAAQIQSYLDDPQYYFDVCLPEVGTVFQRRVWSAISKIPCGQVLTYGDLAKQLNSAPRAIGQACGANYFPIIIPCHRVVAANSLGGFAHDKNAQGFYVNVKRWLLKHEGVVY